MRPGLGILQPRDYEGEVTGTVVMMIHKDQGHVLSEVKSASSRSVSSEDNGDSHDPDNGLKKTAAGIILYPQPRNDPNDPLNWPMWKRDLALFVIGFHSFICGGQTPLLAAAFTELAQEFDVSLSKLSYLVGGFMLALGTGSVFWAPTAVIYGKRVVYLAALIIFLAGALWAGAANSFGSLLGARIIMAIGSSPTEALPSASIAEIFFMHERAYRLGIYTLLLLGGKNLVPMVAGFIIGDLSWNWLFWILSMIIGLNFVLTFLFVPETWWDRTPTPNDKRSLKETELARKARQNSLNSNEIGLTVPDDQQSTNQITSLSNRPIASRGVSFANEPLRIEPVVSVNSASNPVKSYPQSLRFYYGRLSEDKWWMIALRPFVLFLFPGVLFATIIYSLSVVWLIVISETISHIFANEPYNFPPTSVGLLYIGTFIGGCLGSAIAGRVSDILVRVLCRRNNGVYEPEFRLVMIIPVLISVTMGMMGFGWSTLEGDLWIVPTIFLGILGFGCSLGSTTAITYAVDSYKMFASEALVTLNFSKNVLGFCFSLFTTNFLSNRGPKTTFVVFGSVEVFVCLFAIPLYIYGKRCRRWTDTQNLMRYLYTDYDHRS